MLIRGAVLKSSRTLNRTNNNVVLKSTDIEQNDIRYISVNQFLFAARSLTKMKNALGSLRRFHIYSQVNRYVSRVVDKLIRALTA